MSTASEANELYQLYIEEKGVKPTIPRHLTAFAKTKGLMIRFVDARNMIANPSSVVTSSSNRKSNSISTQNKRNHSSNSRSSAKKCMDCSRLKKGKIYEGDGSFYCLECWEMYDDDTTHSNIYNKSNANPHKDTTPFKVNLKPKQSITSPITCANNKCTIPSRARPISNGSQHKNNSVRELYDTYCKSKGKKPQSADQLLQYGKSINIYAKWSEVNKFMKNTCNNKPSSTVLSSINTNVKHGIKWQKHVLSKQCENTKQLMENKEQEQEQELDDECVVCFAKSRSHVCVPCGHLCICQDCVSIINQRCPLCRSKCDNIIKVFK
eukprot:461589_1